MEGGEGVNAEERDGGGAAAGEQASERAETRAGVSEISSIHRAQECDDSEAVAAARERSSNGPSFQTAP